jgi:hypothetical protein
MRVLLPTHPRSGQRGLNLDRIAIGSTRSEWLESRTQCVSFPFKERDGQTPLPLYNDDNYFWGEDGLVDYCEMNKINPEDLRLVICEPNYAWEIDDDYYCDILAEDHTLAVAYLQLADAIEKVNELIRKKEKPLSSGAGKYRTTYSATRQAA